MADETAQDAAPASAPSNGITYTAPKKLPAGWAKDEETGLGFVEATGLVPVQINVSEGGLGLVKGEVRGVAPDVAARMVELKSARLVFPA